MAVLATDTFTRADETPLAGNWGGGIAAGSKWDLVSNSARPHDFGANAWSPYTALSFAATDPMYSQAKLTVNGTSGGAAGAGLAVRYSDVGGTSLDAYWITVDHAASLNCDFARFKAGAGVVLSTFTQAWNDGDTWTLAVSGPLAAAKLDAYLNGALVSTFTDNSTVSSGQTCYAGLAYSSTSTSASADDWVGGDTPVFSSARPNVAWLSAVSW